MALLSRMAKLGIYRLSDSSHVYKETLSYQAALDEADHFIQATLGKLFLQYAEKKQLLEYLSYAGIYLPENCLEERLRKVALFLHSEDAQHCSPAALEKFLSLLGAQVTITENIADRSISVSVQSYSDFCPDQTRLLGYLARLVPAGMAVTVSESA